MSDSKKPSGLSSLMPQQWLAVLLFVASLAAVKLSSLESPRPPVKTSWAESADGRFTLSNVEDPFKITEKQTESSPRSKAANQPMGSPTEEIPKPPEAEQKKKPFKLPEPKPWADKSEFRLFMVFMKAPSDPSFEDIRQTDRQAIASALSARHYIPSENRRLRLYDHKIQRGKTHEMFGVKIPYEWWHHPKAENPAEPGKDEPPVLVLWLNSEEFVPDLNGDFERDARSCLDELRQIVELAECDLKKCASRLDLFGPNDTDALVRLMVGEELARDLNGVAGLPNLIFSDRYKVRFFSAMSTAEDKVILKEVERNFNEVYGRGKLISGSVEEEMNRYLGPFTGSEKPPKRFHRTIATDDQVARRLVDELVSRGVGDRVKAKKGSLLLISEVDTLYGRMLPEAFRSAWKDRTGSIDGSRIKVLTYFKGLDGRYSKNTTAAAADDAGGDATKKGIGGTQTQVGANGTADSYPPRGIAQSDALRRMGFEMRYTDDELDDVIAVGILGTDVFDKLLVIRALRPVMKDAFFFTNNLDAWMWDSKEIETTKGMIAAAPAGIEMGDILEEKLNSNIKEISSFDYKPLHVLPFRNSYQSSLFRTAYGALTKASSPPHVRDPFLFEIDGSGPVRIDGKGFKWVGLLLILPPVLALTFGPIPLIVILRRLSASIDSNEQAVGELKHSGYIIKFVKLWSEIGMFEWLLLGVFTLLVALASPPPVLFLGWCWMLVALVVFVSRRSEGLLTIGRRWMIPGLRLPVFVLVVSIVQISLYFGNRREVFFGCRVGAWFYLCMISLGVLLASLGLWWLYETWMHWRSKLDDLSGYKKYKIAELPNDEPFRYNVVWFEKIFSLRYICSSRWMLVVYFIGVFAVMILVSIAIQYQPHFLALRTLEIPYWPGRFPESYVMLASVVLHSILWLTSIGILVAYRALLSEVSTRETQWTKDVEMAVLPESCVQDGPENDEWWVESYDVNDNVRRRTETLEKERDAFEKEKRAIKNNTKDIERVKSDCIDLHYLADRTRRWSAMLAAPFLVIIPMSAGGLLMDMAPRWSWPVVTIMVLGSAAVVAMGYACHYKLLRMREDVVREIQTVAGLSADHVKALTGSVLGLEHGLFRPFSQQPVVKMFVIALALIGTNEILEVFRRL